MATVALTLTSIETLHANCYIVGWTPLSSTNTTGEGYEQPGAADRSVQVEGTFGGATLVWQGSNDNANWHTLSDPQGNALTISSASLKQIAEIARYMRPLTSGGDGTQALTVTLVTRSVR